jgi:hypothetical protein
MNRNFCFLWKTNRHTFWNIVIVQEEKGGGSSTDSYKAIIIQDTTAANNTEEKITRVIMKQCNVVEGDP